jgi:hypothetical protein
MSTNAAAVGSKFFGDIVAGASTPVGIDVMPVDPAVGSWLSIGGGVGAMAESGMLGAMPGGWLIMPKGVPGAMPGAMLGVMPGAMPGVIPGGMTGGMPTGTPGIEDHPE